MDLCKVHKETVHHGDDSDEPPELMSSEDDGDVDEDSDASTDDDEDLPDCKFWCWCLTRHLHAALVKP